MDYLAARIDFGDDGFHPVDGIVGSHAERDSILNFSRLFDGSIVTLYRLEAVADELSTRLDDAGDVRTWTLSTVGDRSHLFLHVEEGDPLSRMLDVSDSHPVLIERPLHVTDDGAVSARVLGTAESLQASIDELPGSVDLTIERAGRYTPPGVGVLDVLTTRQREALTVAHRLGYYERPRGATYEDIADELGVATSTANALLRSAEDAIVTRLLDR